ncbi:ATP-binding cassette domain-containing protein [Paenibacillus spongiae]|uniref:ABC transporter ATP-binding protein/permease n=1 Tax=Paenibacillus spongiae TaxID=2909671 RepID=A0ABY5SHJ1_9BACL|nr:ABC transporter ATP-binding protein [Paenibacillus spongiae]UVI33053.1 ABC transporter ATP-binding protein/permease [Paenibacillus spongiae]
MDITKYIRCFLDSASILYRVERSPVLVLAVMLLLGTFIMPVELWLVKTLVDRVQAWAAPAPIGPILAAASWLAALMIINNIGFVPVPLAMTRLSEIGTLEEQRLLLYKTSKLPLTLVEAPRMKDLRERALQVSLFTVYDTGCQLLQVSLQSAVLIALMLAYGQWIPVIAISAAALLQMYVMGKSAASLERLSREQTSGSRLLRHYAALMTKREAAKEIRLFDIGTILSGRWLELYQRQSREKWTIVRSSELRKIGPELLMVLVGGLLVSLLVLLPGASKLTAGEFTLLFMALTLLLSQLKSLIGHAASMQTQYMRWADFRAYMNLEEDHRFEIHHALEARNTDTSGKAETANIGTVIRKYSDSITESPPNETVRGTSLEIRKLHYRYPNTERETLHDISLTIPSGCRAALVGENGSGKSTLIKLLTGMYMLDRGEIVWSGEGGRSLKDGKPGEGSISAVFQDFTRLFVTLRENVALGNLTEMHHDARLRNALRSAGSRLGDLDMQIGSPFGGMEPSGGQWQQIATARALLRDAGFVFFDEPTAALDPQTEKKAFDLFLRVTEGRSALLVTHRLGAAKLADVIFVLKHGRLVEQGTHQELMKRKGEYSRMFQLQASWYA